MKKFDEKNAFETPPDFAESYFKAMKTFPLHLELDGIFYVAAYEHIEAGNGYFKKAFQAFKRYNDFKKKIEEKHKDDVVEFGAAMIPKLRNLEFHFEPVIKHFSIAKILLAATAEAHINRIAEKGLSHGDIEEFNKLSIVGKWLLLPKLLKTKKQFEKNSNPMQGFIALIRERNKLIHYKSQPKKVGDFEIPSFLDDYNFTPQSMEKNLHAVRDLIREFDQPGEPRWLSIEISKKIRRPGFYSEFGGQEFLFASPRDE